MRRRTLLIAGGVTAAAASAGMALNGIIAGNRYATAMSSLRAPLPHEPSFIDLVRYATLAANGHNTQPWLFRLSSRQIEILPDFSRRTPVVDPDDHHLFVSLGCAAENLMIAAAARGRPAAIALDHAGSLRVELGQGAPKTGPLFEAIVHRQSTRSIYSGRPVPNADLALLAAAAKSAAVDLVLITDRKIIDRVGELVVVGNTAQMADASWVKELKDWIRFSPSEALVRGDGLYSAASGNPTLPEWIGSVLFDAVFTTASENRKYSEQLASSSGVAVFSAVSDDRAGWVEAGRACQRFALQATALGLRHAFVNQPTEVNGLRSELANLIGIPGRRPNLVMRFGHGPVLPMSARRSVASVIIA